MLTSRRGFLLGTAGPITPSFLREAVEYIDCEDEPLLLAPEIEGDLPRMFPWFPAEMSH